MSPSSSNPSNSNGHNTPRIDKLDYRPLPDERRPLLNHSRSPQQPNASSANAHVQANGSSERSPPPDGSHNTSCSGSFFEAVAEGIQERDREYLSKQLTRFGAFFWAIIACLCCGSITAFSLYGHLFISHLHYSQSAVNIISIVAELGMYLPVPLFGYLCDRYGPRPLSLLAGALFGAGYLLAAFAYKSGPPEGMSGKRKHEDGAAAAGWPFWTMAVAFAAVGMATSCMYLSAVTTCAKNFGRGRYRGLALAIPIAAFGLSGMWQSQVGSQLLYEPRPDGRKGDVDVFRFFLFLGITLLGVGAIGGFALQIVDEAAMIEDAIDELEQSGLLNEDDFFHRAAQQHGYDTIPAHDLSDSTFSFLNREADAIKQREAEEKARKEWLLNAETRRFLLDRTMWWLAAGFFLVTGPGEAFINNLGTVIGTLYPPTTEADDIPTTAATHVSIVAITSTCARLLTGTLTDLLAPSSPPHQHNMDRRPRSLSSSLQSLPEPQQPPKFPFSISRVVFLILFAVLLSSGQILLASGFIQNHGTRFWAVSSLIGAGYGAVFSLTPIIISVVWGVENFGTNWGIVAMVPAAGAAVWGIVYSAVYQAAAGGDGSNDDGGDLLCYGKACYAPTFWAMAASVWLACGLWAWAWRGPGGWVRRGVAV
jgi:MFS family permease